ncbi:MAG: hypothetical protein FWE18_01190 [Alphaproteobacteria bacterium]|nr:hypothetical protein [Alphaproteobacteria bacterium]
MKLQNIALLLSERNLETIESILKNSNYFYEITKNAKIKTDILITESNYLNEEMKLNNFHKIICIIPKHYLGFISNKFKTKKIVFLELPITYAKLIKIIEDSTDSEV